jgi:P2 family phage contractile tail tube protein
VADINITTLFNADLFIDGLDTLGRMGEFSLPQPKRTMETYKALGMAGQIEIPVGWEKLDAQMKWTSFDQAVLLALAGSTSATPLTLQASAQVITSTGLIQEVPVTGNLTGLFKDPGAVKLKAQANAEFEAMFAVWHIDLTIAGNQIYLFDFLSNQYVVGGVDLLAQFRANLGA